MSNWTLRKGWIATRTIADERERLEKRERLTNATASHVELVSFERGDWSRARRQASFFGS